MVVLSYSLPYPLVTIASPALCYNKQHLKFSSFIHGVCLQNPDVLCRFKFKSGDIRCRIKCFEQDSSENHETAASEDMIESQDKVTDKVLGSIDSKTAGTGSSFLAKLVIILVIALITTLTSIGLRQYNQGSLPGIQYAADTSSLSSLPATTGGFSFKAFGYKIMLPEYAPGWIYFWLLMAAGCGLFISEEALNIWDTSPEYFFAGVCCGGLITLPIQLAIGFLMRERPVFALATVASVVGIWTIFPYAVAGLTAVFLYLQQRYSS